MDGTSGPVVRWHHRSSDVSRGVRTGPRRDGLRVGLVAAVVAVLVALSTLSTMPVALAAVPVAQPRISVGPDLVVGEGDGSVTVPVRLSAPGQSTVTVQYSVASSTAVASSDYVCPVVSCNPGTLTFAPGE